MVLARWPTYAGALRASVWPLYCILKLSTYEIWGYHAHLSGADHIYLSPHTIITWELPSNHAELEHAILWHLCHFECIVHLTLEAVHYTGMMCSVLFSSNFSLVTLLCNQWTDQFPLANGIDQSKTKKQNSYCKGQSSSSIASTMDRIQLYRTNDCYWWWASFLELPTAQQRRPKPSEQ